MNMLQFVSSQKSMQRCCSNLDDLFFYSKIGFNLYNRSQERGEKTNKQTELPIDHNLEPS